MKSLLNRSLTMLMLAAMLLQACSGEGPSQAVSDNPAEPAAVTDHASQSAGELAAAIMESGSGAEAMPAVQEVLKRGGIAVGDLQSPLVDAEQPASSLQLLPHEVLNMAEEARSGPSVWRMDLHEFGQMLGDLGWPVEDGSTAGEQLAKMLVSWGEAAAQHPDEVENFTPRFLLAMAQQRAPEAIFATGETEPEDLRFGLLELMLLSAAFDRLVPAEVQSSARGASLASLDPIAVSMSGAAISPCKPFQDSLFGKLAYSNAGEFILQFAAGKALEKAFDSAGMSQWGKEGFSKAMFSLGMATRVLRAGLMATFVRISVRVEGDNPVHKPLEGEQLLKAFQAQAGISEKDRQAHMDQFGKSFNDATRECLTWLGIMKTGLDEIMAEMDSWSVEWRLTAGSPEHATWSPGTQIAPGQVHLGVWRTGLAAATPSSSTGESSFVVEIQNEKESNHPGTEEKAAVRVCAFLDTAQAPNFSTFAQAALSGLAGAADSAVELMGGMMEKISKPKACSDLRVTFHKVKSYRASGQKMEMTLSGIVCDLGQSFTIDATSPYYYFTILFTPESPEGGTYTYSGYWTDGNVGPMEGNGSYLVQRSGSGEANQLQLDGNHATHTSEGDVGGRLQFEADLMPLTTDECGPP